MIVFWLQLLAWLQLIELFRLLNRTKIKKKKGERVQYNTYVCEILSLVLSFAHSEISELQICGHTTIVNVILILQLSRT